jgi:hypothetical protein
VADCCCDREGLGGGGGGGGCKFRHVHQCMRAAPSRSGQVRLPAALEAGFETGGARRPSERNVVGVVGEGQQE